MSDIDIQVDEATLEDSQFVLSISNDEVVRKNSFNTNEIQQKEHENWMNKQLSSNESMLLILRINGERFGVVKFSKDSSHWIIGISIGQDFRGKSLSAPSLIKAIEVSNIKEEIYAYIKPTNVASMKSFKKAGFSDEKEVMYNGNKCILMRWK